MDRARSPRARGVAPIVATLVVIALVGIMSYSFGRLSASDNPHPTDTSAEAGFSRDMQVHHNQGVELAMLVRDRTDDPEVRLLAYDIATTQAQQSGQFYGWLTEWGLQQLGSEPSMTWMTRPGRSDTSTHGGAHQLGQPMPGLATSAQVAELTAATGLDAERTFLTLMIAHHKGAVEMAEAVMDRASNTSVRALASSIIKSQQSEMNAMTDMLAERT